MENEEIRREAAYRMEQLGQPQWVADDFMNGKLYVNDMMFYGHGPFPLERMGDLSFAEPEIASLEEEHDVMIFAVISNGLSGGDGPYDIGAGHWRTDHMFRYLCVSRDPADWPAEREMALEGNVRAILALYTYDLVGYSVAEAWEASAGSDGSCRGGALECYAIPGGDKLLYAPQTTPVGSSYETAVICVGCYEGEEILSLF